MPRSPIKKEREDRDKISSSRTHSSHDTHRERNKKETRDSRESRDVRESRDARDREPRERDAKDQSNNINKRRREEDERDTNRDNRPRYYQSNNSNIPRALMDKEIDEKKLSARQRQIDYGKNTIGYQKYLEALPKEQRKRTDIWTPDKQHKCSKRSWDGQVRQWRRLLHEYDPPAAEGEIEIDLENDEDDISKLQQELDDERNADDEDDNKENDKITTNKPVKSEVKTESKTEVKIEVEVKTEITWKTKLPFMESLENEKWADMV